MNQSVVSKSGRVAVRVCELGAIGEAGGGDGFGLGAGAGGAAPRVRPRRVVVRWYPLSFSLYVDVSRSLSLNPPPLSRS